MDKEVKELEQALERIWDIATNKYGLDPYPTRFEIVPSTVMYEIGSYALPGRYSHWTFGKAYHKMKTMYDLGLSKIYEVVINSNPSYAFLLDTNSLLQNKLVIAHVLGHVDFFKHNAWFGPTNRRMLDDAQTHATRISEYEFKYGRKVVEEFLDAVLSIEEHIDPNFFIKKQRDPKKFADKQNEQRSVGQYDDLLTLAENKVLDQENEDRKGDHTMEPEKDLVWFILQNSPSLQPWQRDVMSMIHDEMLYFVPQMQTKIMNEGWACCLGDSLLLTERGFVRFDELYEAGEKICVAGGSEEKVYPIAEFHKEEKVPTICIRTRRGLKIEGALKHRLLMGNGSWEDLRDVKIGDRIAIECGSNIWPAKPYSINFVSSRPSLSFYQVEALTGVPAWAISTHLKGRNTHHAAAVVAALETTGWHPGGPGKALATRTVITLPESLDEEFAAILGYFVGDGNRTKSGICFTCGEEDYARRIAEMVNRKLGLRSTLRWDATEIGGRWRLEVHSRELLRLLESLGFNLEDKAPQKKIPTSILQSPKTVISAFLRGYFDADAYAGKEGIRLSSSSDELIRTVQIVLLNYGILSRQREHLHEIRQLEITGASAARFLTEIGFGLERKQQALRAYVESHQWFKQEDLTDEIVSIETGCADVYDITVDEKHAYVANGFINHNSIWHSRLMRELDLPDNEHIEFAELHSGVVSPSRGQLNPYYLGYKIYEDIEKRWNNPTKEEIEKFGRKPGEGMAKLFEVREVDNDVSFLRNYLTEELCEELDLFVYELIDEEDWTITEKRWERVRDQLVANMTNFGFPYIEVVDGDYDGNRELYLRHRHEGADLDMKYARKVLEYVYKLWGRPVHLETKVEEDSLVMHYDGDEHNEN